MAAATIDEYLAGVPDDKRVALERLREQIHAAAPEATEAISYAMPAFKLDGRYFVAFAEHRSRPMPMSSRAIGCKSEAVPAGGSDNTLGICGAEVIYRISSTKG